MTPAMISGIGEGMQNWDDLIELAYGYWMEIQISTKTKQNPSRGSVKFECGKSSM